MSWYKLADAKGGSFYVDVQSGKCLLELPSDETSVDVGPGCWYELYDLNHKRPYYYHLGGGQTVWTKPKDGVVLPLTSLKKYEEDADKEMRVRMAKIVAGSLVVGKDTGKKEQTAATTEAKDTNVNNTSLGTSESLSNTTTPSVNVTASTTAITTPPRAEEKKEPRILTDRAEDPSLPPLAENWIAVFDTKNQRFYYANRVTKQTSWFRKDAEDTVVKTCGACRCSRRYVGLFNCDDDKIRSKCWQNSAQEKQRGDDTGAAVKEAAPAPAQTPAGVAAPNLPDSIRDEIHNFQFEGFARKYFSTHKKGVFRREVPIKELLEHSKSPLDNALLFSIATNKVMNKEALACFKLIQMYMGDKPSEKSRQTTPNSMLQIIVDKAINHAILRDELYCQIIKQCTNNTTRESLYRGWDIVVVFVGTFPPTRDFNGYVYNFLTSHFQHEDERIRTFSTFCARKLLIINQQGARGRVPSADELDTLKKKPFNPTSFGSTLPIIMELQQKNYPDLMVPIALTTLTDAVVRLGGCKTQGIFRIPGDTEESFALKLALERGVFAVKSDDPHVPASVLKLWLRELDEPLIPPFLYDRCIKAKEDPSEISNIMKELPEINRYTLMYLVRFLQIITAPANIEHTKMTVDNVSMVFAPNFLRCPYDDPAIIFENTRFEQQFVKSLLQQLKPDEYLEQ